jgi:hypothetical protein
LVRWVALHQALKKFVEMNVIKVDEYGFFIHDSSLLGELRPQSLLLMTQIVDTLQTTLDDYVEACNRELLRRKIDDVIDCHLRPYPADVKGTVEDALMYSHIALSVGTVSAAPISIIPGNRSVALKISGRRHPKNTKSRLLPKSSTIVKPTPKRKSYRDKCTADGHGGPREARSCKICTVLDLKDELDKLVVPSDIAPPSTHSVLQSLALHKPCGTYFCPNCLSESLLDKPQELARLALLARKAPAAANVVLRKLFQPTNKCTAHAAVWNAGYCPCGHVWRSCTTCRVACIHPYAGLDGYKPCACPSAGRA